MQKEALDTRFPVYANDVVHRLFTHRSVVTEALCAVEDDVGVPGDDGKQSLFPFFQPNSELLGQCAIGRRMQVQ